MVEAQGRKKTFMGQDAWAPSDLLYCEDLDGDGDTYVSGLCPGGNDCLDSDPDVNPGETEGPPGDGTCTDGLDNNCDGLTDETADPGCVAVP